MINHSSETVAKLKVTIALEIPKDSKNFEDLGSGN